ncbi:MAG TPA: erythromycin esterase family protein [Ramlibacter sp.]|nr:erythromycin esterase family protein [Ramlibacter sp.]
MSSFRLGADTALLDGLRGHLQPLPRAAADDHALLTRLAQARLALLGEASHGTHEFYAERAELTQRLIPRDDPELARLLAERRLQRAIGVIYLPHSERLSHYFHTRLPAQFDAMIHIDRTRAVEPLVPEPEWHAGEPPETYPSGL